jgi:hypothetical protein
MPPGFLPVAALDLAIEHRVMVDATRKAMLEAAEEVGDLVLWDGHVGIVTDPQLGKSVGAQASTGVAEATCSSGYWVEHKERRFVRLVHFFQDGKGGH